MNRRRVYNGFRRENLPMIRIPVLLAIAAFLPQAVQESLPPQPPYETREKHDPNGINKRIEKEKVANVETVKCTETDPKLPESGVDLVLMVDVYHELTFPYEVMSAIRKALKPGGRVVLVEFRKEDPKVPIKEVHKMSEEQIKKEMAVVGLGHLKTVGVLPWQHIAIFTKKK